jgi:alcohol dehydrogenase (cytochrome c)
MKKLWFSASFAALALAGALGVASAADYTPVTDARLANPEPENWLMTRGNYSGWSYSPLDQINASNIKGLVPVWAVSTGVDSGHEAPPIVNNGIMFVATPYSQVMALDAATGEFLWRYKHKNPANFAALHNTSRGVALWGNLVFLPGLDATLTALDARTGKVVWESKVDDYKQGYYLTMAPLVV